MNYFTNDFLAFFIELAPNNNKDWFDKNRERYKTSVKEPFEHFITDLITELSKFDDKIAITYKDAIFRINRDIRFSKDKTPYKLNRSAIISPKGKKDKAYPGMYLDINPEFFRIYGGVFKPDKEQLYRIREEMVKNPAKFEKIRKEKQFFQLFGEVRGDKNKIIPKEFKDVAKKHSIIYNKQWYWFTELEPEVILQDDILEIAMDIYRKGKNMMDYFTRAMMD